MRLLGWVALELLLAGAAFLLTAPQTRFLQTQVFGWWPDAWTIRLGTDGQYGVGALLITAALLLLGTVIVALIVEEPSVRGYLPPPVAHRYVPDLPA